MKIICSSIALIAFLATPAMGAEIWGMVRKDGMPQEKFKVKLFDGKHEKSSCDTDKFGLYSLFLRERGHYDLKVYDEEDREIYSKPIASYKTPVRCDVHLLANPEK